METEKKPAQKISTFLWFDHQAEEAAQFYTSLFKNSRIGNILRYGEGAPLPAGTALTVTYFLDGQEFVAMNAGPHFKFNESISLSVKCYSQEEVDFLWERLTENGGQESQCGWLKDKYGLSWQIVPVALTEMLGDEDKKKASAVMQAMMKMRKIEISVLKEAYDHADENTAKKPYL